VIHNEESMMPDPIYQPRGEHPIALSSAPILRGFSRLGIGCAVLIAIIGVVVTATVVMDDYNRWVGGSGPPAGVVLGPPSISTFVPTVLIGGGITITACLLIIGFFRGLGWVVAGFARD
jgi:hypothetical protein